MDETRTGLLPLAREIVAQTCSLVAPRRCPCGQEGAWLCPRCTAMLAARPVRVETCCDALQELTAARIRQESAGGVVLPAGVDHTPVLPVLALGEYTGPLQHLVLAWKNGGMLHLGARLAPALAPGVRTLAVAGGVRRPLLVPVPSRRSARLRRGEDHTAELARALARTGAGRALPLRAVPTTAQEGRGSRQRRTRRIHLAGSAARRAGRERAQVVILDDVVTTGATLRGMHDALTQAGMQVLGAVVVASARVPAPDTAGNLDSQ
ncbi:ComF family protein [Brachybacterium sacelli]|uniref:Amidophosphoribosyltransferase n=1 Tax=Brachybacterium sacelli TaxID=173364 RepID=A0ABS4X522_9MICO|nr:phosphoribosyltransferase family protein [Brachybacterium sacelli]MBP2383562.1 putative amidophosphoribosyltransferase [Brachybacterium sacelli]